jgi:hypothetical protein
MFRNVKNKELPFVGRTINNWFKYRRYIKQYQGVRDDLVDELLNLVKRIGFNNGVERFELYLGWEQFKIRQAKEEQLKKMSAPKTKIEQVVEEMNKMKQAEDKVKNYKWDPYWKPSVSDMLNSDHVIFYNKIISPDMYLKIYHVPEKLAYVGISVVPGCKPEMVISDSLAEVIRKLEPLFDSLSRDVKIKKEKSSSNSSKSVNIDHVKKAMGVDEQKNNNNINNIDDALDDIF